MEEAEESKLQMRHLAMMLLQVTSGNVDARKDLDKFVRNVPPDDLSVDEEELEHKFRMQDKYWGAEATIPVPEEFETKRKARWAPPAAPQTFAPPRYEGG